MASDFSEKYRRFMSNRNGPDQLSRDALILALVLFLLAVVFGEGVRQFFLMLGLVAMGYSYFRLFSTNRSQRARENAAYVERRRQVVAKIGKPFAGMSKSVQEASRRGQKMADQAKDKEHRYFACPKCGQTVRVPRGAGKIRVTCPKCGDKFEKKA